MFLFWSSEPGTRAITVEIRVARGFSRAWDSYGFRRRSPEKTRATEVQNGIDFDSQGPRFDAELEF